MSSFSSDNFSSLSQRDWFAASFSASRFFIFGCHIVPAVRLGDTWHSSHRSRHTKTWRQRAPLDAFPPSGYMLWPKYPRQGISHFCELRRHFLAEVFPSRTFEPPWLRMTVELEWDGRVPQLISARKLTRSSCASPRGDWSAAIGMLCGLMTAGRRFMTPWIPPSFPT